MSEIRSLDADVVLGAPVVDVAGIAVRLAASDRERANLVAGLFRHASPASSPAQCEVRLTDHVLPVPDAASTTLLDDLDVWRSAPGHLVLRSPGGLIARVSPHHIEVAGSAPSLAREFRYLCLIALTHLLAHHDRHVLHAGAVLCNDRALLVLGGSGCGKSTLVLSALRSGWLALADDLVAVYRRDGIMYACGLPRPISVPLDVLADELAAGLTASGGPRNRAELPGSTLTKSAHPVGGIALVSHGDSVHASIEPLAAHDALTALLSASTSLADPVLLRQVFPLSAALARLPGWSLRHGTDADSRLEQASCCLEEIRRLLDEMSTS